MTLDEKIRRNCPMEGTDYAKYCDENYATIRVKIGKCSHRDQCNKLKKELDEKYENQRSYNTN